MIFNIGRSVPEHSMTRRPRPAKPLPSRVATLASEASAIAAIKCIEALERIAGTAAGSGEFGMTVPGGGGPTPTQWRHPPAVTR